MSFENKIIAFKLDKETLSKLMSEKRVILDHKKNDSAELVLPDTRIKLEKDKKTSNTATYYNNKSTNLFYFGSTETAIAISRKVLAEDKKLSATTTSAAAAANKIKESEKTARGIESLDIPSIPPSSSPLTTQAVKSSPTLKASPTATTSTLKKSSAAAPSNKNTTNNNYGNSKKSTTTTKSNTPNNNIPQRGSVTPQITNNHYHSDNNGTTPRTTATNASVANEKPQDRAAHLLALRPFSLSTLAKMLELTQWEVKKIADEVGIFLNDKKKYCLKPIMYKKIRIWDWPAYTNEERQKVIDNAKEAYDILNIPSDSMDRYNLLDPKTRGPPPKPKKAVVPVASTPTKASTVKKEQEIKKRTNSSSSPAKSSKSTFSSDLPSPAEIVASMTTTRTTSPLATKQKPSSSSSASTRQQQLKPSSSNKKQVGSKVLPSSQQYEKLSPPTKRKSDLVESSHSAPPTSHPSSSSKGVGNKRLKSTAVDHAPHLPTPIELSNIKSQSSFDKYCLKFITGQKEYQNSKTTFKSKFPHYIKVLQSTKPPTSGSKRSWLDTKLEYYDLVKENYLKVEDEVSWEEASNQLRDCQQKRRRLNYMWSSIEKNLTEHQYKLNYKK